MQRIDVHKLADESRFNPFHGLVLFWGILILVLDGYDLAVIGGKLEADRRQRGTRDDGEFFEEDFPGLKAAG